MTIYGKLIAHHLYEPRKTSLYEFEVPDGADLNTTPPPWWLERNRVGSKQVVFKIDEWYSDPDRKHLIKAVEYGFSELLLRDIFDEFSPHDQIRRIYGRILNYHPESAVTETEEYELSLDEHQFRAKVMLLRCQYTSEQTHGVHTYQVQDGSKSTQKPFCTKIWYSDSERTIEVLMWSNT